MAEIILKKTCCEKERSWTTNFGNYSFIFYKAALPFKHKIGGEQTAK